MSSSWLGVQDTTFHFFFLFFLFLFFFFFFFTFFFTFNSITKSVSFLPLESLQLNHHLYRQQHHQVCFLFCPLTSRQPLRDTPHHFVRDSTTSKSPQRRNLYNVLPQPKAPVLVFRIKRRRSRSDASAITASYKAYREQSCRCPATTGAPA